MRMTPSSRLELLSGLRVRSTPLATAPGPVQSVSEAAAAAYLELSMIRCAVMPAMLADQTGTVHASLS